MNHYANLDSLILPSNSCQFELEKNQRGGIRIRSDENGFDIEVR